MSKVSLINNEIVEIAGETHPELGLCIHVDMKQWDKEALGAAKQIWADFLQQCINSGVENIYCGIDKEDLKHEKFAVMFGFAPTDFAFVDDEGQYKLTLWVFKTTE